MASFGRLAAALVNGSQETTLALANLNFDFALFKIEAPPEFQGLGQSLSKRRKNNAEAGSSHITARKLGALFEDGLPDVPHLLEAYGRRVTEIAQNPQYNPKGTVADGPFQEYVKLLLFLFVLSYSFMSSTSGFRTKHSWKIKFRRPRLSRHNFPYINDPQSNFVPKCIFLGHKASTYEISLRKGIANVRISNKLSRCRRYHDMGSGHVW